jgi:hypothetical protein
MKSDKGRCPVCDMPMDDNHFTPVSSLIFSESICCNCHENISLMFVNFQEKPGNRGYIVPDHCERLEKISGRSYLENRLIFYCERLKTRQDMGDRADSLEVRKLKAETEKIAMAIKKGGR